MVFGVYERRFNVVLRCEDEMVKRDVTESISGCLGTYVIIVSL